MQTHSHFLITAALDRPLKRRGVRVSTAAFLAGSVLPDIPFFLLTLSYTAYYLRIAPRAPDQTMLSVMEYLHTDLFFHDPVWIVGHNFLHAPLVLLALGGLAIRLQRRGSRWGAWLLWFVLGAGLHTTIDIFTHHSDGPLVLFPLNWSYRFPSPISYWERDYYGWLFAPLELLLDGGLAVHLFRVWRRRRAAQPTS